MKRNSLPCCRMYYYRFKHRDSCSTQLVFRCFTSLSEVQLSNLVPRASLVEREEEGPGKSWLSHDQISNILGKFITEIKYPRSCKANFPTIWENLVM